MKTLFMVVSHNGQAYLTAGDVENESTISAMHLTNNSIISTSAMAEFIRKELLGELSTVSFPKEVTITKISDEQQIILDSYYQMAARAKAVALKNLTAKTFSDLVESLGK